MSSKQKIKLVQIIADGDLGGGPKHVLGLLSHLDKSKFDCYLICPEGDLARQARDLKGIEVITTLMRSKFDLVALSKIKKALNQIQAKGMPFGPMIVHTHGPRAGLLGRWAAPKGIYSVYTEHRWDGEYHLENKFNEWLQLTLLKRLNSKTNLVVAVSESVKNFLAVRQLAPGNRIQVIPNGIDLENVEVKRKKVKAGPHHIIGNVGNLNHQKGHIYLVEAMSEVIKKYPHATLEIIGEGPERALLEEKIKEMQLEKHVTLLGRQTEPLLHMAKWDVFALSSVAETFGIVLLEAFAIGLPVVSTNIGGVRDILAHNKNALLVEPENSHALAESILELLERPALAEKFIRAGKIKVKEFDWKEVIKKIEKAYLDMIR